jgi:magnesium transporter
VAWLLVLVFVAIPSFFVMRYYEVTTAQVGALVFFMPLLIGSAGNAGSQSSTLMVRALATGDITGEDWLYFLWREIRVAATLGGTMAAAVYLPAWFFGGSQVAFVVSITMVWVVILGSLIGMSLPFLLERLELDPAIASAPLVASVTDMVGVFSYLTFATWYLGVRG